MNTDPSPNDVLLITHMSPDFSASLRQCTASSQPVPSDLLSFFAILHNRSRLNVVSYAVRWSLSDLEGNTDVKDTVFDRPRGLLDAGKPKYSPNIGRRAIVIPPNGYRLVSLASDIGGNAEAMEDSPAANAFVADNLVRIMPILQKVSATVKHVEPRLDLYVFEDGTYSGDNRTNHLAVLQGYVTAKQDLMSEIISLAKVKTPHQDIENRLNTLLSVPDSELSSDNVQEWFYKHFKKQFASDFLRLREHSGFDQALGIAADDLYSVVPHFVKTK